MRSRRRATWLVFGACVGIVALVLVLITWQGLRLERQEQRARAQAEREEAVRLALWRMDSLLTPIIAREAGRPYFHYRSFYPAERAYTRMWQPVGPGDVLVPSPLLDIGAIAGDGETPGQNLILLHFQVEPDGSVTSPQAPTGNMLDLAESGFVAPEAIRASETLLAELTGVLQGKQRELFRKAPEGEDGALAAAPMVAFDQANRPRSDEEPQNASRELQEYFARQQVAERASNYSSNTPQRAVSKSELSDKEEKDVALDANTVTARDELTSAGGEPIVGGETRAAGRADVSGASDVRVGPLEAMWVWGENPRLLFVREASVEGREVTQGFWVDWPALSSLLLGSVRDLLPQARLEPAQADDWRGASIPELLATAPVRLEPGPEPTLASVGITPTRATLVFSWLALVAAAVAIGLVLRAAIQLSERRGTFVSAVTHELRTPLTTFRLYSQMLADGMVSDEAARREYLSTLKSESGRLSGIVENVLEYARLSRRRAGPEQVQELTPEALLVRLRPTLSRRAEQSGMDLIVSAELDEATRSGVTLSVDPHAVERILMNLVENACKYAGPSDGEDDEDVDPRIHLDVRVGSGQLEMLVADYGPGIPARDRARIFGEFQRGASRVMRSGLGLGLALSRGLAREAGGDLRLVRRRGHGAEFLLTLPLRETGAVGRASAAPAGA
ncbi:MAG: HAMP domain-containing sensor histidine kinase [Phycisphaerales bacterium]